MIFADPPYLLSSNGISCSGGKMVSVNKGDWDKSISIEEKHKFNRKWIKLCYQVLKDNGTIWVSGTMHNIYSIGMALEEEGFKVTFAEHVMNSFDDEYNCAKIEDRVKDLEEAFKDKNVKAILTVIGGYNSNQLLKYIDYDVIKENPKILCGYSDITALLDSIYAKTGLVTYYGPHYSSFGMKKGFEYTLEYFRKMFIEENEEIDAKSVMEIYENYKNMIKS